MQGNEKDKTSKTHGKKVTRDRKKYVPMSTRVLASEMYFSGLAKMIAQGINKTYSVVCLFVHSKMTFMLFMLSKINFNEGSNNSGSAGTGTSSLRLNYVCVCVCVCKNLPKTA